MPQKERLLRFTIMCYRQPTITADEFNKHWTTSHGPLVKGWLARHGVIKYTQYHTPKAIRERSLSLSGNLSEGNVADFDGFVELLVRENDFECLERARQDPYYGDVVAPDEEKFIDMGRSQMIVGWEEVYVEDGKTVDVKPGEGNVITG